VYQPTSWVFYALQFLDKFEQPVNANAQQVIFLELDAFTALPFTATAALPVAKVTRILSMIQHAWRPITFGMKGNN
jgi:ATP-dependent phosphoenolpyruvate carboxykinase